MLMCLAACNSGFGREHIAFVESVGALVDSFCPPLEHGECLKQNSIDEFEAFLSTLLRRFGLLSFQSDEPFSNSNSVYRCREILRTVISEGDQRSELVNFNVWDLGKHGLDCRNNRRAGIDCQRFRNSQPYRTNRTARNAESRIHSRCTDACSSEFVPTLSPRFGGGSVESDDYCGTRSSGGSDIPEILGRTGRSRDERPYAKHGQKTDCDQQPHECELSDFPRAFHDFPVFDFRAIVARPAEGA